MTERPGPAPRPSVHTALLAATTFLMMMPETLPVPVLRGLVLERFAIDDAAASLFMAANMLGALLAAPIAGLWVDRTGRRRRLCLVMLMIDALAMQALAHPHDFGTFLALRAVEGAVHIVALTLLMSLTADAAGEHRGRAMGWIGAGLTIGVATGAALGGLLGREDPLLTLHAGSAFLLAAAALGAFALPPDQPSDGHPGWREVAKAVRTEPGIRAPLFLAFVDRFTVGFFTTGFPLMMAGVHGVDRPAIGMMLAAFLFPFGFLSYPFGRLAEHTSRRWLVAIGSLVYGVGVCCVGLVPTAGIWALMPALGVGSAVMFIPTLLWLLDRAPGIGRTTAMASFHAAGSLGFLLGPLACALLVGLAADASTGYVLAFACAGLLEILGAWAAILQRVGENPEAAIDSTPRSWKPDRPIE